MKIFIISLSIILIITLSFSCSNSTSPEETPPLGDFLYGTYDYADCEWSPNRNGNPIYYTPSIDVTFLTLNSNGNYSMNLKLYVAQKDTIFNINQVGSYVTMETEYVKPAGLGADHWKGILEFSPEGETVWKVDFLIYKYQNVISFRNVNEFLFELPDSAGFIWITKWMQLN